MGEGENYQLPIPDSQLPITHYPLPMTTLNCQLSTIMNLQFD
ncbi:MAG: hypothetical protein ACRC62_29525 [Microcoleus sp.]